MDSTNPATNTPLESYEQHSQPEVDGMLGDDTLDAMLVADYVTSEADDRYVAA